MPIPRPPERGSDSPPHTRSPCLALTSPSISRRILHELCKSLGLNLTKFTQYDENTWIEVNNLKLRNYVVEKMPEKLGYKLRPREKGHSPEEIYQMALNRVGSRRPEAGPFLPLPSLLPAWLLVSLIPPVCWRWLF